MASASARSSEHSGGDTTASPTSATNRSCRGCWENPGDRREVVIVTTNDGADLVDAAAADEPAAGSDQAYRLGW